MIAKSNWRKEVLGGKRFKFGKNWKHFLESLSDDKIKAATKSLKEYLEIKSLEGKTFLDIGCGSGLMSLAARKLGAKVFSFDFDKNSVECSKILKELYFKDDINWTIEEGSVLNKDYLRNIGKFDFVYSWGVLHHTGSMATALNNVLIPLSLDNGILAIAIYNQNGIETDFWKKVKAFYNKDSFSSLLVKIVFIPYFTLRSLLSGLIKHSNPLFIFFNYRNKRGMNVYNDWIDWLGGYPFEVAKAEEIFKFYKSKGGKLTNLITTRKNGNNQFVFEFKK